MGHCEDLTSIAKINISCHIYKPPTWLTHIPYLNNSKDQGNVILLLVTLLLCFAQMEWSTRSIIRTWMSFLVMTGRDDWLISAFQNIHDIGIVCFTSSLRSNIFLQIFKHLIWISIFCITSGSNSSSAAPDVLGLGLADPESLFIRIRFDGVTGVCDDYELYVRYMTRQYSQRMMKIPHWPQNPPQNWPALEYQI